MPSKAIPPSPASDCADGPCSLFLETPAMELKRASVHPCVRITQVNGLQGHQPPSRLLGHARTH